MNKGVLAAMAIVAALSTAALAHGAFAMTVNKPSELAAVRASLVQRSAVVCGYWGCAPTGAWRHHRWGWDPQWGAVYPPACQFGYYFACRRGPLGYGQCACWPNWTR
jgi:hypothetical protein